MKALRAAMAAPSFTSWVSVALMAVLFIVCLLYTSDAADE